MVSRRKAKKSKVNHGTDAGGKAVERRGAPAEPPPPVLDTPEPAFTFLGDGSAPVTTLNLADAWTQLTALSLDRARLYGTLLNRAYDQHGDRAFWDEVWVSTPEGGSYKAGEYIRTLVTLEAAERDRAFRLLREAVKTGLDARAADLRQDQARTVVLALMNLARYLGIEDSVELRRTMQRSVIEARQRVVADAHTR